MEGGWNWEHNTLALINELTEGMEVAKQLKLHLHSSSSAQAREVLLQRMSSSFEKALLILKWSGGSGGQTCQPAPPASGVPETSISAEESPRSEDLERGFKDHQDVSKKRKLMPTWTEQVKVNSENGVETPADDGYSWRKYGQKDILGAKYPRSYYRCTYRNVQNCWATKQVQRSDEDHTVFDITYKGTHTCNAAPAPPSPEKQEPKQMKHLSNTNSNLSSNHHQQQQSNGLLYSYRTNLRVNTDELVKGEMSPSFTFPSTTFGYENQSQNYPFSDLVNDNLLESFCPSFVSPATSGSNFFGASPSPMNSMGGVFNLQHSESELTEIISANTSTTNSPILDLDFPINPVDLEPNFPFDNPGFFN